MNDFRYQVISPDGGRCDGFEHRPAAEAVALEQGEGAHLVDTVAAVYTPLIEIVEGGGLKLLGFGAWNTAQAPARNLIDAVKKGYEPLVRAFLAKGGDLAPAARDGRGATALHWAVAGGKAGVVALLLARGADPEARDGRGTLVRELARQRHPELLAMLDQRT
ncbi:MAG: ankyrin repeat domain-containing protein [Alphaproteobacteria bacterium]|nr:ankyrin repeat domain-containing protein [Alphaproteobacteria bacterium]